MKDLTTPLLLITGLGLMLLLVNALRQVDQVNRIIEANNTDFNRYPKANAYLRIAKYFIYIPALLLFAFLIFRWQLNRSETHRSKLQAQLKAVAQFDTAKIFETPDPLSIKTENDAQLIQYGRDLIAHTADYLGPNGLVKPISNGMNCQNCHIEAGSKPFGNNYTAVAATYTKFRARSGTAETIYKRVND